MRSIFDVSSQYYIKHTPCDDILTQIKMMLYCGHDINMLNHNDQTILDAILWWEPTANSDLVSFLLSVGATTGSKINGPIDNYGTTYIDMVIEFYDIVEFINYGLCHIDDTVVYAQKRMSLLSVALAKRKFRAFYALLLAGATFNMHTDDYPNCINWDEITPAQIECGLIVPIQQISKFELRISMAITILYNYNI
jgi:hypothetical protein